MIVFVAYPVLCILASAVRDDDGAFAPGAVRRETCQPVDLEPELPCGRPSAASPGTRWRWRSWSAPLTTLLGLAFALIAMRTRLSLKPVLRALSVLPIITPPFVIGLALILLFGRAGLVTDFLAEHARHSAQSRWIYGFRGISIAQVLAFTPIAYLVLLGVLQGVSPSMEEAAQTLRASRWHVFLTVTWPLIRPGLANAFLVGFIESMADFANPLVIGGNFNVLVDRDLLRRGRRRARSGPRRRARDHAAGLHPGRVLRAALLGGAAQLHDRVRQGRRRAARRRCPARARRLRRRRCCPGCCPPSRSTASSWSAASSSRSAATTRRRWRYFQTAFSVDHGVGGWFLSGSAWPSFLTTVEIALIAMPITAALGILDRVAARRGANSPAASASSS